MKEQWFILFDRLAVLHHETLPKRFHTDCEIDEVYLTWCDKIQRHNWPPFAVTTKRPPLVQPLPVAPLHSTDLFVEPPLVEPLPVDPAPPEEAGHSPPPPEEPSEELVPPLPVDPAPPEEAGHSPPPPEQPSEELVPPEEPSRQIKVWEHVETSDGTSDITTLNTWPQIPKLNPIRDDWDGKTKEENTWNPHWKSVRDGDPKYFFGDEEPVTAEEQEVPSYFAGTLRNDSLENFTEHWYSNVNTDSKEDTRELPVPRLDPKKMEKFVDYSFQNWGWSSNKQFLKYLEWQRHLMEIKKKEGKNRIHMHFNSSLLH